MDIGNLEQLFRGLKSLGALLGIGDADSSESEGDGFLGALSGLMELLQIIAAQCQGDGYEGAPGGPSCGSIPSGSMPSGSRPGGGRPSGSAGPGGPTGPMPAGNVGSWIQQAMQVLQQHGVDTSKIDPRDVAAMIKHESGGNPRAQNNWDSNAKKGTPSKGLMQTIQPTFNRYKLPGYGDVWNPVHNIVAAVRYSLARYGSISNVPGVKAMHRGQGYRGY